MAVRSKRLWSGGLGAGVVLYTAASGETVLIKTVTMKNASAASTVVRIGFGNSSGVGQLFSEALAVGEVKRIDCWLVLMEGQTVNASAVPAAGTIHTMGFGAELEGVAD